MGIRMASVLIEDLISKIKPRCLVRNALAFNLAQHRYLSDTYCSMLQDLHSSFFGIDGRKPVPSAATSQDILLNCVVALEELDRVAKEAEIFMHAFSISEDWWKSLHRADIGEAYEVFLQEITWSVAGVHLALGNARGVLNRDLISSVVSRSHKLLKKCSLRDHVRDDWHDLLLLINLLKQRYEAMSADKKTLLSPDGIHKYRTACFLSAKFAPVISAEAELPQSLSINAADIKQTPSGSCLGAGVCEGTWLGQRVAVKEFRGRKRRSWKQEATLMAKLRNPYIVSLIGTSVDEKANAGFLVMEWMSTNLHNWITQRSYPVSLVAAVDIMLQISKAMRYLHGRGILHRDLKPSNILVQPSTIDHFAEQGHARVKLASCFYQAPNAVWSQESANCILWKRDVHCFGSTCYEIVTGTSPLRKERLGLMPAFPSNSPSALFTLIQDCWAMDPCARPTFVQISERLRYVKLLLMIDKRATTGSTVIQRLLLREMEIPNQELTSPSVEGSRARLTVHNRVDKMFLGLARCPVDRLADLYLCTRNLSLFPYRNSHNADVLNEVSKCEGRYQIVSKAFFCFRNVVSDGSFNLRLGNFLSIVAGIGNFLSIAAGSPRLSLLDMSKTAILHQIVRPLAEHWLDISKDDWGEKVTNSRNAVGHAISDSLLASLGLQMKIHRFAGCDESSKIEIPISTALLWVFLLMQVAHAGADVVPGFALEPSLCWTDGLSREGRILDAADPGGTLKGGLKETLKD